jgi:hypothetical protein
MPYIQNKIRKLVLCYFMLFYSYGLSYRWIGRYNEQNTRCRENSTNKRKKFFSVHYQIIATFYKLQRSTFLRVQSSQIDDK